MVTGKAAKVKENERNIRESVRDDLGPVLYSDVDECHRSCLVCDENVLSLT